MPQLQSNVSCVLRMQCSVFIVLISLVQVILVVSKRFVSHDALLDVGNVAVSTLSSSGSTKLKCRKPSKPVCSGQYKTCSSTRACKKVTNFSHIDMAFPVNGFQRLTVQSIAGKFVFWRGKQDLYQTDDGKVHRVMCTDKTFLAIDEYRKERKEIFNGILDSTTFFSSMMPDSSQDAILDWFSKKRSNKLTIDLTYKTNCHCQSDTSEGGMAAVNGVDKSRYGSCYVVTDTWMVDEFHVLNLDNHTYRIQWHEKLTGIRENANASGTLSGKEKKKEVKNKWTIEVLGRDGWLTMWSWHRSVKGKGLVDYRTNYRTLGGVQTWIRSHVQTKSFLTLGMIMKGIKESNPETEKAAGLNVISMGISLKQRRSTEYKPDSQDRTQMPEICLLEHPSTGMMSTESAMHFFTRPSSS